MLDNKEADQFKQFQFIINQLNQQVHKLPSELDGFQQHILAKLKEIQHSKKEDLPSLAKNFLEDVQQLDVELAHLAGVQQKTIQGLTEQLQIESLALKQQVVSPSLSEFSSRDFYPATNFSFRTQLKDWLKYYLNGLIKFNKTKKTNVQYKIRRKEKESSQPLKSTLFSSKHSKKVKIPKVVKEERVSQDKGFKKTELNKHVEKGALAQNKVKTIKNTIANKEKNLDLKKKSNSKLEKYPEKLKSTQVKTFTKQLDVDDPSWSKHLEHKKNNKK